MEALAPIIPDAAARRPLPLRAPAVGPTRGTVALLEGCVMSVLFGDINRDTMRLLSHAGFDVVVPAGQTCCGALHEHDGDLATARALAATNAASFAAANVTAIVSNSAGCGAALKGYGHLLADNAAATALAQKTVDITRFLVDHAPGLRFVDHPETVTYDAPCHLHHAQGETTAPLALIKSAPGVTVVPMAMADLCCGAAGIYNVDHPAMSAAILDPKLDALIATGAGVLLTGNPGCIMQWRMGIARRGLKVRVEHPVTFLAARLQATI
jgi:glycolate oxidase iron-sulfur subunit